MLTGKRPPRHTAPGGPLARPKPSMCFVHCIGDAKEMQFAKPAIARKFDETRIQPACCNAFSSTSASELINHRYHLNVKMKAFHRWLTLFAASILVRQFAAAEVRCWRSGPTLPTLCVI